MFFRVSLEKILISVKLHCCHVWHGFSLVWMWQDRTSSDFEGGPNKLGKPFCLWPLRLLLVMSPWVNQTLPTLWAVMWLVMWIDVFVDHSIVEIFSHTENHWYGLSPALVMAFISVNTRLVRLPSNMCLQTSSSAFIQRYGFVCPNVLYIFRPLLLWPVTAVNLLFLLIYLLLHLIASKTLWSYRMWRLVHVYHWRRNKRQSM